MIYISWADLSWWHVWQLTSLGILLYLICRHGFGQVLAWCGTVLLYGALGLVGVAVVGLVGYGLTLFHDALLPQMAAMGLGEEFTALWRMGLILGGLVGAVLVFTWVRGSVYR